MKKVIALLLLVAGLSHGFAQDAKKLTSGDDELDKSIQSITSFARKNRATFESALVAKYAITELQAKDYYTKVPGGDLYMSLAVAKESGKSLETVLTTYENARKASKGWSTALKDLGIKQNSKSFETIKSEVVNNGID